MVENITGTDAQVYDGQGALIAHIPSFEVAIEVTGEEGSEVSKPKRIETLEDATRYAFGVAETRKEIVKLQKVATSELIRWQEQIQSVEDWLADSIKPLQEKLEYFNLLLTNFHINEFMSAENEKAQAKLKSIKLPYGITLASKEQATKIEITDEAALLTYAKTNNFTDTPEPKAKWADIKKTLKINEDNGLVYDANGEEVTFVIAVPQDRKFEVK
jgi:hypothetical protein